MLTASCDAIMTLHQRDLAPTFGDESQRKPRSLPDEHAPVKGESKK
jgi:hypothetical protein